MATVRLENITKRFGDLIALDDINLDIRDEEFFVLLGQTGAGKTTTLRCIAGLDNPKQVPSISTKLVLTIRLPLNAMWLSSSNRISSIHT